jgi:uncharacterized protein (DUF1501 family)
MHEQPIDRRTFLAGSLAAGGALAGSALPGFAGAPRTAQTQRVVLIAFAGGVRTRETLGTPGNVPNLVAMGEEGVVYTRTRSANLGHFGAALSLFTGISEARGIRENARGNDPTLFEYVRKDLGLPASEVWISTSGGAQQTNYSYGLHPEYGPSVGANTLDGDGIFNKEFRDLIGAYGRPREMEAREDELLQKMRASIGSGSGEQRLNSPESAAKVERYILDELTRGTADIRGANAADAKALRVARNLLTIFKPKLIGVVLQQADIAHGSFNGYAEVIRQNDAAIGELWQAVKDDAELRATTALVVLPEFGRDRDLNSRRGLDHGDGTDDLNYVSTVCWGPDFARGVVVKDDVRAIDVCPTVCELLGANARYARGKRLPRLMA